MSPIQRTGRARLQQMRDRGSIDSAVTPTPRSSWLHRRATLESGATRVVAIKLYEYEVVMNTFLVSRSPEIINGAFCFTGIRVLVKNLFDYLEGVSSLEGFLDDFPSVSREKAAALLEAAHLTYKAV